MTLLLILLLGATLWLTTQLIAFRSESASAARRVAAEVGRVTAEGEQIRALLGEASRALLAIPDAAKLATPDPVPALTAGLASVADGFIASRDAVNQAATSVASALHEASEAQQRATAEFKDRGERIVRGMETATSGMAAVAADLHATTAASLQLHEELRSTAVSFQMVQDLIERLDALMPQVGSSSLSLQQLIERVEQKNLFSERVFDDFEGALAHLADAVVDLAAVSRTFASHLDHAPGRVDVLTAATTSSHTGGAGTAETE